ncbi:AER438Cp [Eremothecium gossypii ATCC 10895]|uniref:AER438Cp n=1 Tax=Eremothecium gossypii (strain ATCC 10895 / CBS 109.51 / FGSC 9923 / NRRL Y-1056) TaxID=284811 RepID=Q755T0_EREGS|nr:AER438Cp [Eremothecium gossypii ATCC 10895]AAS53117.2 AER438Cp [Eremothecium gossypii ATCC 10895]AEY97426.1 FAER438Cp [Eremothecium gossypii FDAG1]
MVKKLNVHVTISDASVVNKSYVQYTTRVRVQHGSESAVEYKCRRRFSEFLQLKLDLEREFDAEIPYDFPARKFNLWNMKSRSCDPAVVDERRERLTSFLTDLLNDSFDVRWKTSPTLCAFLNMPDDWWQQSEQRVSSAAASEADSVEQLQDVSKWLESIRDAKSQFEDANRNGNNITMMRIRLKLQKLEEALAVIQENKLVGEGEISRRWIILNALKADLNKQSGALRPRSNDNEYMQRELLKEQLLPAKSEPHRPAAGRRKLGETSQTVGLNNQQLLQLHKDSMKDQDFELEQLRSIVQRQKIMSLNMNQELAIQNEMLDMFADDVNATSNKLRMANISAKRFNERK